MKSEVIHDSYYVGFEGEPEIILTYENSNVKQVLKLWCGYFETLLDCMVHQASVQDGILREYYVREGWYEESPWEIKNAEDAYLLFKSFDINKLPKDVINELNNIAPILPLISSDIAKFIKQANDNEDRVYIVYD